MKKRKIYGTVVTAAFALSLTACGSIAPDNTVTEASAAGVAEKGGVKVVKVAHTNYYKPYDFATEDGESDGYEVAVLKAVDELLEDYEFEYTPTTDDDLLIGVESGKYDIGTKGVWWTPARAETYVFPENYIGASVVGITYRTEDADKYKDLESFAKEGGKLVPIAPQNAQYSIIENFNASHQDTPIELEASDQFNVSDAYQWVIEGRYDAYFSIKTSFEANVVAEDGEYHDLADKISFTAYEGIPTWPLFNRNDQELADKYDEAIEKLKADGTLEELSQKYFGESIFKYVPEGYKKGDTL
ncbi:amino acid ABC transporter substrate-binding protein, PAAT family [Lachnospiraceae bacterium KH1T2]|nr:amino acid ABC transporter substrate-binding protein, PAAT family [Lachnospiraceae bacterium KH1T2]